MAKIIDEELQLFAARSPLGQKGPPPLRMFVRRALVREMIDRGLSERRALTVARMSASAFRYEPRPGRNIELREKMQALASQNKRYGVGMIHLKLRQAGWPVNYKRVEWLYQEAKLQVRRRKRKKVAIGERQLLSLPTAANQVWSMDFVFDGTADGRVLKCLTIVDEATPWPWPSKSNGPFRESA